MGERCDEDEGDGVMMKPTAVWLIVRKYLETLDREVDSIAISQGLPSLRGALIDCLPS